MTSASAGRGPLSRLWPYAGIFLLALSIRLVHLAQVRDLPTARVLLSDARSYWDWSGRIAAGEWWRGEVFYQAPLYPYFLALVRATTGGGPETAKVVQAFLGATACVLLARAGSRLVARSVGLLAGILLAVNAPAVFFDGLIQKTALDTFLLAALLACLAPLPVRPRARTWFWAGLLLGLFSLSRENALVLALVVPAWGFLRFRFRDRAERTRWLAAFAAGLVLVLGLVGIRNASVGGGLVLTTAQLGPNLYIGNNPRATGTYVPLRPGREDPAQERADATALAEADLGRPLSPREVSAYWARRSWEFARSQPGHWSRLTLRKLLLVLNSTEVADAEDFYTHAGRAPLLRVLSWFTHFGVVLPLSAAGMVLARRARREISVLLAVGGTLVVSVVPFYVMARYRFPVVLPSLVLAAAALALARECVVRREVRRLVAPAAALAGAALLANAPLVSRAEQRIAARVNLGLAAAQLGRLEEAIRYQEEALREAPALIQAHFQKGVALQRAGRDEEAMASFARAIELDPTHAPAHAFLGWIRAARGETDAGIAELRRAVELDPTIPVGYEQLLDLAARRGDEAGALVVLQAARESGRSSADLWLRAGWGFKREGRLAAAVRILAEGRERHPRDAGLANALAWILATAPEAAMRDPIRALELATEADRLSGGHSPAVLDTKAAALAAAGRVSEAAEVAASAAALARDQGDPNLSVEIEGRLRRYRSGRSFLEE